jgi:hypothetical protein
MPTTGAFFNRGEFVYMNGVPNPGVGDAHYAGTGGATAQYCIDNSVTPNAYNVQNSTDKTCLPFYKLY